MKNAGKVFEEDFKRSVPEYCYLQRLNDSAQAMQTKSSLRFSLRNPCDFIMFDTKERVLYALELKSTKSKSISFETIDGEKTCKMIHRHQILGLMNIAKYNNTRAGFILNYRKNDCQKCYYLSIQNFRKMSESINKLSFTEADLLLYGGIELDGHKMRTHYKWELTNLLSMKEV